MTVVTDGRPPAARTPRLFCDGVATADDGYEKGSERKALEALNFQIYHNSEMLEEAEPKVH